MPEALGNYASFSDGDLLDLLYTAGDRLPRAAVDEILSRGGRLREPLGAIVAYKPNWTQPLPEWWAAVHATYILGAMEDPATLVALLTALRWADAFDCDWVSEDLPSMLGRLGRVAFDPVRRVALDPSAGGGARSIALASLAALAFAEPDLGDEVIRLAASLVGVEGEDLYLRQTAANVLVDLRATGQRELLLAFGREEARRKREDAEYQPAFYDWEVEDLLAGRTGETGAEYYRRDWLDFYDPQEIERRQERWRREREESSEAEASPAPEEAAGAPHRDLQAPCSCGSGRPFSACCYLKVH